MGCRNLLSGLNSNHRLETTVYTPLGNGCVNLMGAWLFLVHSAEKPPCPQNSAFLGGGVLGFSGRGRGGKCQFYFYGRGDFPERSKFPRRASARALPLRRWPSRTREATESFLVAHVPHPQHLLSWTLDLTWIGATNRPSNPLRLSVSLRSFCLSSGSQERNADGDSVITS